MAEAAAQLKPWEKVPTNWHLATNSQTLFGNAHDCHILTTFNAETT